MAITGFRYTLAFALIIAALVAGFVGTAGTADAAVGDSKKPHSLKGYTCENSVTLHWQLPNDEPTGEYRFNIYRHTAGATAKAQGDAPLHSIAAGDPPVTTWTDTGLNSGDKWVYRVATRKGGNNNASNVSNFTSYYRAIVSNAQCSNNGKKYKAHTLRATVDGSNNVVLKWQVAGTHKVNGYRITRKTKGGSWTTLVDDTGSNDRNYTDSTTQSGQTYAYRVEARYRGSGCSNNSCEGFGHGSALAKVVR